MMELRRQDQLLNIPDGLWHCLQLYYQNLHWENVLKDMDENPVPWTLVHGDLHPGNVMWMPDDPKCKVRIFDWEYVGIGSGPQELGAYIISHLDCLEYGCDVHKGLVRRYYEQLVTTNPEIQPEFSFKACFENFVYGGFRFWLRLLPQLASWRLDFMPYFFHQIDTFRRLYDIQPEQVGYPTV